MIYRQLSSLKLLNREKKHKFYVNSLLITDLSLLLDDLDLSNIDKFLYVFHLIYSKSVFNKTYKTRNQFIYLHSGTLRFSIGVKYNQILSFLEKNGFIEVNHRYCHSGGSHFCKSYRLTEKYRDCQFFLKETNLVRIKDKSEILNENHKYLAGLLEDVSFDNENTVVKAIEENVDSIHSFKCADAFTYALNNKDFHFSFDENTGRVFNIVVNMPHYLRKHLLYNKEKLFEIDIKNCQILLLNTLYTEKSEESERFKHITENLDFYDYLIEKAYPKEKRDKVKLTSLMFLFDYRLYPKLYPISDLFKNEFPILYSKIKEIKKEDYKKMAMTLQKREADAMIGCAVEFARENKIPVFPVHDSFMIPKKYEEIMKNEVKRVFMELYGLNPAIRNMEEKKLEAEQRELKQEDSDYYSDSYSSFYADSFQSHQISL